MQQFEIRIQDISFETQTDAVEDNDDPFKSPQSGLDELKLLSPTLVPDGTTTDDFTDADQTLSVAGSATIDNEEMNHYRESHNPDITSDNTDEESSEELGPPK